MVHLSAAVGSVNAPASLAMTPKRCAHCGGPSRPFMYRHDGFHWLKCASCDTLWPEYDYGDEGPEETVKKGGLA